jgi:aminoglycoside phosphotransferase (APT) family kinase protein
MTGDSFVVPAELAPVRPGEDLDWDALARYLRDHLPELAGEFRVLQFPNGSANLTYLVQFGEQGLVVRRPPFGRLAPRAHDMQREYRSMGLPTRAEVIERYAAGTGLDLVDVKWYEAFACWKTAVVLQQLYTRYLRGEPTDERMATRGDQVVGQARRAMMILDDARL